MGIILEPESAASALGEHYLRMMLLGAPKIGKTCSVLTTCPKPVYVINSDKDGAISPAVELMVERRIPLKLTHNLVLDDETMESALKLAKKQVKENGYKTVVWDTISGFSDHLLEQCIKSHLTSGGKEDGRKYWPEYHKRIGNFVKRLLVIQAHVIVISHWEGASGGSDEEPEDEKDENGIPRVPKSGFGIVPLLGGKSRRSIGRHFDDVVFLEKRRGKKSISASAQKSEDERVFKCNIDGVWGPGSRSLPGTEEVPADVKAFIEMKEKRSKGLLAALKNVKAVGVLEKEERRA